MTVYYSAAGWQIADEQPEGTVEVAHALYASLMGMIVEPGPDGQPREIRAHMLERAKVAMRVERRPIIEVLDGLQASATATGNTANATAIETAKQALRDITSLDLSACNTFDEMRLAVKARYTQIVSAAPPSVRLAFAGAMQ